MLSGAPNASGPIAIGAFVKQYLSIDERPKTS
jgi:hypothetical protein